MKIEKDNSEDAFNKKKWSIGTLLTVRFAFFVEQVHIDVMLIGIQEISVNHMLSNEGGGDAWSEGRNTNRSRSQKQAWINGAPSSQV